MSLFTGNRLTYAQAADLIRYQRSRYAATGFVEADHPRDGAGKFTDGGDSADSDSALDASGEPMWKAWQKKRKAELAGVGAIKGDGSGPEAKLYDPPAAKPTQVAAPDKTKVDGWKDVPAPGEFGHSQRPNAATSKPPEGKHLNTRLSTPQEQGNHLKMIDHGREALKQNNISLLQRILEALGAPKDVIDNPTATAGPGQRGKKFDNAADQWLHLQQKRNDYITLGKQGLPIQGANAGARAAAARKNAPPVPAKDKDDSQTAPEAEKPAEAKPDASPFEGWHAQTQADRWLRHREGGYYEADTQQVERYSLFGRR